MKLKNIFSIFIKKFIKEFKPLKTTVIDSYFRSFSPDPKSFSKFFLYDYRFNEPKEIRFMFGKDSSKFKSLSLSEEKRIQRFFSYLNKSTLINVEFIWFLIFNQKFFIKRKFSIFFDKAFNPKTGLYELFLDLEIKKITKKEFLNLNLYYSTFYFLILIILRKYET